ncbi:16S rRNA methyltransferase, partial [Candidatus Pacearchaeota archaeon CG_4_9_14_0_2_um_filter_39_13]
MEHNENPDFDKGQHMLADVRIINREIEVAGLKKDDKVLEIGAGQGALTEALAGKCNVVAFEQDSRFKERLSAIEKRNDNLKIIYGDALSYSWMGYDKIVSNIPYLLSESILIKAVKSEVPEMVLIVGEKFKEKLFSDSKIG